jgi:hypothetical protein
MFCHPVLHWFVAIRTLLNVSFGRSAGLVIAGLPYPFLRVIPSQAKAGTDAERSQSTTITLCEVVLKRKTKQLSCSQTPWQNVHKSRPRRPRNVILRVPGGHQCTLHQATKKGIYLFILSYGLEPMGYGLKMRKKARKEKQ